MPAFSFVDRITRLEPGVRAEGCYQVPASVPAFPPTLVAESIGQLAAWVAMEHLQFRVRPVAGIAAEAKIHRDVEPGATLSLAVEIESCSESDVAYGGRAHIDDRPVVELAHCLGPMLPMETFDDPEVVRERFGLLRGSGASGNGFTGLIEPQLEPIAHEPGQRLRAELHVPETAPFFSDHFPRRAVYPATLLVNTQIGIACRLAAESELWPHGSVPTALRVLDVKMRSFVAPGTVLEVDVELAEPESGRAMAKLTARIEGRRVEAAKVEIGLREGDG